MMHTQFILATEPHDDKPGETCHYAVCAECNATTDPEQVETERGALVWAGQHMRDTSSAGEFRGFWQMLVLSDVMSA